MSSIFFLFFALTTMCVLLVTGFACTRVLQSQHLSGELKAKAYKYFKGDNDPLICFELKGGIEADKKFINSFEMFYHVANIGDARSLVIHRASTAHSQLSEQKLPTAGPTPGYAQLCIGLKRIDDIISDLTQAIYKAFAK